jgi:hypothetical protein
MAAAQDKLAPGKKGIETKWIKNEQSQMSWCIFRDTAKLEIGKVTTTITKDNGKVTVVSNMAMKKMTSPWVDSTVADAKTLKPIYHSSYNQQRDMTLHFGTIVTGTFDDKIKKNNTVINDTTRESYFDSNLYPTLIRWLPLKEGYRQDLAIYDYNPDGKIGVLKASVNSVTKGTYSSVRSGIRNVWIVAVTDELGDKNSTRTYYIDIADRKLWKQEMYVRGTKMMMQLIEPD